jgi:septal ring factor EnvC (AmiA/AmiB activator)
MYRELEALQEQLAQLEQDSTQIEELRAQLAEEQEAQTEKDEQVHMQQFFSQHCNYC